MKKKTTMKVARETTRIEKEINKVVTNTKLRILLIFLIFLGSVHLSNMALAWLQSKEIRPYLVISAQNQSITFQTPLRDRTEEDKKFHSPIPQVQAVDTKAKEILPTPKVSGEEAVVKAVKHGDILWKIYQLESQRGKEDYCRNNGKGFGGFGVKVNETTIACYPTFEIATERASYWFGENLNGRTLHGALCKWSGFGDVADCFYARNYEFVK